MLRGPGARVVLKRIGVRIDNVLPFGVDAAHDALRHRVRGRKHG